jgi:hypothetical protein
MAAGACIGGETSWVTSPPITAAAAGTWTLGDLTVNRIGFGAMRLTGSVGRNFRPLPGGGGTARGVRRPAGTPDRPGPGPSIGLAASG